MPDNHHQINFTGLVVTYNEERHLNDCLKSLRFCEQLIVIDLGSSDGSVSIAKKFRAELIVQEPVPIVEIIRKDSVKLARNDWIIYLDPDEVLPANIEHKFTSLITTHPNLGFISIPWQFYFKGKPLYFSVWGSKKTKPVLFHKNRTKFYPEVHRGVQLVDGYTNASVPSKPHYYLKHYWIDSYRQLIEKHWRYIKNEGKSRYNFGEKFTWNRLIRETLSALKYNLKDCKGTCGGFLGIFLSFFYAWYVGMSLLSLLIYQKQQSARMFNEQ